MSFLIYLAWVVILIGGVAWALVTAGIATLYVVIITALYFIIASIIMGGMGILPRVADIRAKDPAP